MVNNTLVPKMKRTMISIPFGLKEKLKDKAERVGLKTATYIRFLLTKSVEEASSDEK